MAPRVQVKINTGLPSRGGAMLNPPMLAKRLFRRLAKRLSREQRLLVILLYVERLDADDLPALLGITPRQALELFVATVRLLRQELPAQFAQPTFPDV